jgi:hypothetical protein
MFFAVSGVLTLAIGHDHVMQPLKGVPGDLGVFQSEQFEFVFSVHVPDFL